MLRTEDVDDGGGSACIGLGHMGDLCTSAPFCCEPKSDSKK